MWSLYLYLILWCVRRTSPGWQNVSSVYLLINIEYNISIKGSFHDLNDLQVDSGGFSFYKWCWPRSLIVSDIVFLVIETRYRTGRCAKKREVQKVWIQWPKKLAMLTILSVIGFKAILYHIWFLFKLLWVILACFAFLWGILGCSGPHWIILALFASSIAYSQVPNNCPPCILMFEKFSNPPAFIPTPLLFILRKFLMGRIQNPWIQCILTASLIS